MNNYGYTYLPPETIQVTPEKFLELKSLYPNLKTLGIIPPSIDFNDYGKILILASSLSSEYSSNAF